MSVYTSLDAGDIQPLLDNYGQGSLIEFKGIEAGIENTNYFVSAESKASRRNEFVLTLFETTSTENLDGYFDLMAYLAGAGLPAAMPFKCKHGTYLTTVKGKPAALIERLTGTSANVPNREQCGAVGRFMALMHRALSSQEMEFTNARGAEWRAATITKLTAQLSADQLEILNAAHHSALTFEQANIPRGVIHGDLFHDNALYEGNELKGVIDFYYAHRAPHIYDLAVCIADWCFVQNGCVMNSENAAAVLEGYQTERELSAAERGWWIEAMQLAGLRFYLSRLHDKHFPRPGSLTQEKDPSVFLALITLCRNRSAEITSLVS